MDIFFIIKKRKFKFEKTMMLIYGWLPILGGLIEIVCHLNDAAGTGPKVFFGGDRPGSGRLPYHGYNPLGREKGNGEKQIGELN